MARSRRRAMSQINVVPYIDVMLVLLVIFMVAAPLMPTGNIDLPTVGKASQPPASPLEVTVRSDKTLGFRDSESKAAERTLTLNELGEAILAARDRSGERPVVIAGDKNVQYDEVMKVVDKLNELQIKRVGLKTLSAGR